MYNKNTAVDDTWTIAENWFLAPLALVALYFESKLQKEADSRLNVSVQLRFSASDVLIRSIQPHFTFTLMNTCLFYCCWQKKNSHYYNNY